MNQCELKQIQYNFTTRLSLCHKPEKSLYLCILMVKNFDLANFDFLIHQFAMSKVNDIGLHSCIISIRNYCGKHSDHFLVTLSQSTVKFSLFDHDMKVNYLNWLPNRPFTGGEKYNCMELVAETITTNSSISLISEGKVADSECSYTSCPVCRLEQTVRY